VLPVLAVSDSRVSPWTETPEHRVKSHIPLGGASGIPLVLWVSRGTPPAGNKGTHKQ